MQGDVAGNLMARLVQARVEGGKLEVKCSEEGRGHSQVFHRAPTSIVPSTEASASTLKRRESELTRIAESVCGGSEGARVPAHSWAKENVISSTGEFAARSWAEEWCTIHLALH